MNLSWKEKLGIALEIIAIVGGLIALTIFFPHVMIPIDISIGVGLFSAAGVVYTYQKLKIGML